jgi:hypothetical protein
MKEKLLDWVIDALKSNYGEASVLDVSKHIWEKHSYDLENSGNFFYTWQYDVRWAGVELRKKGILKPADEKKLWVLDNYNPKNRRKTEKLNNINLNKNPNQKNDFNKRLEALNLGKLYSRKDVGKVLKTDRLDNHREGLLSIEDNIFNKKTHQGEINYNDYFEREFFRWDSQNRQHPETTTIKKIINNECKVWLFARIEEKINGKTEPFVFCGQLKFLAYDKETSKPVHIIYRSLNYNAHLDRNLYDLYNWKPSLRGSSQNRPLHKISRELTLMPEIKGYKQGLVKKIKDLIFEGKSIKEIVDIVNLRPNEVKNLKYKLDKVYQFPKFSKLKRPITEERQKVEVINLSKKELDTKEISGKLNIFESDVKEALKEFIENDQPRYSNQTFNEIHEMLKKKVSKTRIAKDLNLDILIVTEVENKILKYFSVKQNYEFSVQKINQILRMFLNNKTLNQIRKKTKINQDKINQIKSDIIREVKDLLIEKHTVSQISKKIGISKDIIKSIEKNELKKISPSNPLSDIKNVNSNLLVLPDYYNDIRGMLLRDSSVDEMRMITGKSPSSVRLALRYFKNQESMYIHPKYGLREPKLSEEESALRQEMIKKYPKKTDSELAVMFDLTLPAFRQWKFVYYHAE